METNEKTYKPQKTIEFTEDVRFNNELTFGERILLAEIKSMTRHQKCPLFSHKILGNVLGVSPQTVKNWLTKLVKLGLVQVELEYANAECQKFLTTK
jgi:DNA-binding MarR family transcriptional regulator